ncbi:MAG: glycosyl transferase family 2 [Flavobacteriia bacterium]|nr:glycosyl transferase family 2 [Flavobacteriia bacterium]
MSQIAIIIQARTGSTRLPKKILKPFYKNLCSLELLINRIKLEINIPIIIATSVSSNDDEIELLSNRIGVICFRGNEDNVLDRFIECAKFHSIDTIIRVCSDNPFLDINYLKQLIHFSDNEADYTGFIINKSPSIKTHYGIWAERVSLKALLKVQTNTEDKIYFEHVTNFIYSHPKYFAIEWIPVSDSYFFDFPIRLTLDTPSDFDILSRLYQEVVDANPLFTIKNVLEILSLHKDFQEVMHQQIIENSK